MPVVGTALERIGIKSTILLISLLLAPPRQKVSDLHPLEWHKLEYRPFKFRHHFKFGGQRVEPEVDRQRAAELSQQQEGRRRRLSDSDLVEMDVECALSGG